ncbi:hypothetical protein BO83DRAFT_426227 [Aspergillus eucalypticola CBS 122712]|uniref:nitrilase n=1 Tax=Aspergillus eucalypticola (strain CBS 122712 / IBT 29274) TaxID=1448314 RepID=A0A317VSH2_ASPEC|nr:uncharacterized protein BO83DRAFT_426227 [Aspergillus eucalypticola CBS 122712]PWY75977.1 hypothetical protein BO83DRAFT_426227 [Aspergillus eucalypticola CBS 122712]
MAAKPKPGTVRVAVVQAEGCYFGLPAAVQKTCDLRVEAAGKGCDLVAIPEVWIPQYPGWIWQRPINDSAEIHPSMLGCRSIVYGFHVRLLEFVAETIH